MKLKYVSLALLAPSILLAMESADLTDKVVVKRESSQKLLGADSTPKTLPAPVQVALTMEEDQPPDKLSGYEHELLSALRSGRTTNYVTLLAQPEHINRSQSDIQQTRNADQIVSALALVNSALPTEQSKQITSQLQALFPRYQYAIPPAAVASALIANFVLTCIQFDALAHTAGYTVSALDKGQFAINLSASALGAFIAGLRTAKQLKKGWYDTRQDKAVENLKGAQLTLTLLQKAGLNDDGTIKAEYVALIQKQEQLIAVANLEVAQATVAAQQADAEADATEAALANKGKEKEDASPDGQAPTRSLIPRGASMVVATTGDRNAHDDNNVPVESALETDAQAAPAAQEVTQATQSETPGTRDEAAAAQGETHTAAGSSVVVTITDAYTDAHAATSQENAVPNADTVITHVEDAAVSTHLVAATQAVGTALGTTEDDESFEFELIPNPACNPHKELANNTASAPAHTPDAGLPAEHIAAGQAADEGNNNASTTGADDSSTRNDINSTPVLFTPSETLHAALDTVIATNAVDAVQEQAQEAADATPAAAQETSATENAKVASPVQERAKTPEAQAEVPAQEAVVEQEAKKNDPNEGLEPLDLFN